MIYTLFSPHLLLYNTKASMSYIYNLSSFCLIYNSYHIHEPISVILEGSVVQKFYGCK